MSDPPTTVVDKYEQAALEVIAAGGEYRHGRRPYSALTGRNTRLIPALCVAPPFAAISDPAKRREAARSAVSRLLAAGTIEVVEYVERLKTSNGFNYTERSQVYVPVDLRKSSPFEILSLPHGDTGQRRQVARYTCDGCGAHHDIPVVSGRSLGTDLHRNTLVTRGCDVTSRGVIKACPQCQPKEILMNEPLKPTSVDNIKKMLETTTAIPPVTLAPAPPPITENRKPTPDQRLSIRSALDHHFDDATGCYLNGYSDQRIAEELKIPRRFVEDIREAAYGPIRVNPEVLALQEELKKLKTAVQVFEDRLRKLEPSQG